MKIYRINAADVTSGYLDLGDYEDAFWNRINYEMFDWHFSKDAVMDALVSAVPLSVFVQNEGFASAQDMYDFHHVTNLADYLLAVGWIQTIDVI